MLLQVIGQRSFSASGSEKNCFPREKMRFMDGRGMGWFLRRRNPQVEQASVIWRAIRGWVMGEEIWETSIMGNDWSGKSILEIEATTCLGFQVSGGFE